MRDQIYTTKEFSKFEKAAKGRKLMLHFEHNQKGHTIEVSFAAFKRCLDDRNVTSFSASIHSLLAFVNDLKI